jgi:hypothetical protein
MTIFFSTPPHSPLLEGGFTDIRKLCRALLSV